MKRKIYKKTTVKKSRTTKSDKDGALDKVLSRFNPKLKKKIKDLSQRIGSQKYDLKDLRFLGLHILEHVNQVRKSLTVKKSKNKSSKRSHKK